MDDNFIKLLDKSLSANGFTIQKPMEYSDIRYLATPNTKQYNYTFDDTVRDDEKAAIKLTERLLHDFKKDLKFIPLFLPDAYLLKSTYLCRYNNLIARFIQSLKPYTDDEIIYRWDILVRGEWR